MKIEYFLSNAHKIFCILHKATWKKTLPLIVSTNALKVGETYTPTNSAERKIKKNQTSNSFLELGYKQMCREHADSLVHKIHHM